MPLTISPVGRVLHVRPVVPIQKDRVPSRHLVEESFRVLRQRVKDEEGRKALDNLWRAFTKESQNG